jgi:hypothetical protein
MRSSVAKEHALQVDGHGNRVSSVQVIQYNDSGSMIRILSIIGSVAADPSTMADDAQTSLLIDPPPIAIEFRVGV